MKEKKKKKEQKVIQQAKQILIKEQDDDKHKLNPQHNLMNSLNVSLVRYRTYTAHYIG
ncbi:hypothetical protein DOY81_005791 [Sarcophaga bullata]|nr:hypothetical protein DOY81_005791 [Sarcophaga bullata]